MQFSCFGEKFTAQSGISQLMDDLGNALAVNKNMLMLGGGNPSHIPVIQKLFRQRMMQILQNQDEFERMIGNYDTPQGDSIFITALAALLQKTYGWKIKKDNILLTNGSQSAFFALLNMLAGLYPDGSFKKILLPLVPEYIGYSDVGITADIFISNKPQFEFIDAHIFKYHIDFKNLTVDENISAICLSRPTNPTGNVLTDDEIDQLYNLAMHHNIPLIIDAAYGMPFPDVIYSQAQPVWDENIILCLSLSKLGLPGLRTGIIIANPVIIQALSKLNAIMTLAPNSAGAVLALDLVQSGEILTISHNTIKPYYQKKMQFAVQAFHQALQGTPYRLHKPEGAFFLWLWFENLPVSTKVLYTRLKQRGVLIIPGQYFYPGMKEDWQHRYECIRVSYTQADKIVAEGIKIIGEEVKKIYA